MYKIQLESSYFPAQTDANIRDISVGELLREVASSHPNSVAMVDVSEDGESGQSWSYADLFNQAEQLAQALVSRFEPRERVVVWAPNIPEWIFMEYAAGLAGLVLVTANPSFQAAELKYVLEQSGAVGLFMVDEFRGNPMRDIMQEATKGNSRLREVTDLQPLINTSLFVPSRFPTLFFIRRYLSSLSIGTYLNFPVLGFNSTFSPTSGSPHSAWHIPHKITDSS